MLSQNSKIKIQNFGRFLSNMVMPNIGAFIAWGFITALFIPTGWLPNETLANMVGPMITYLLPLLIGYTGGKLVGGDRGAVVGAITTMGVIVGTDIPMFMGAMIVGPAGGWAIKHFDQAIHGKVKSGFEMLVNNFSAGIIGMICAIIAYLLIGPLVKLLSVALASGVGMLVDAGLLPLTSIFVEVAKILFLNNAINHGIFTPLGIQQASEFGQSIFFLIEANPGPGMGVLLAYTLFGRGNAKQSAAGASIIHFFGGIHEIYFPYVLMNPRLLLAVIAGGMTGVFTLTMFNAGLQAPASPGSIFAVMLMTPKGAHMGVALAILASTAVSFVIAALLMKTQRQEEGSEDELEAAAARMQAMKAESKGQSAAPAITKDPAAVRKIIVACDAGMGSSAMAASMLSKKVAAAGLGISVSNLAINNLDDSVDIVLTHKDLTDRARRHAPQAEHISLNNFLDGSLYDNLVARLSQANAPAAAEPAPAAAAPAPAAAPAAAETAEQDSNAPFRLKADNIHLGLSAATKEEAIRFAGEQLVKGGYVEPDYVDAMLAREKITSTYLGESIAVPHGTVEAKDSVKKTGVIICQYPQGVKFGDDADDIAKLVIAIAARNNEHLDVIAAITGALDEDDIIARLASTQNVDEVLKALNPA